MEREKERERKERGGGEGIQLLSHWDKFKETWTEILERKVIWLYLQYLWRLERF